MFYKDINIVYLIRKKMKLKYYLFWNYRYIVLLFLVVKSFFLFEVLKFFFVLKENDREGEVEI